MRKTRAKAQHEGIMGPIQLRYLIHSDEPRRRFLQEAPSIGRPSPVGLPETPYPFAPRGQKEGGEWLALVSMGGWRGL
jgi:hypothetical protein